MKELLEIIIPRFLYFQLFFIFCITLYIILGNRKIISSEIKKNKKLYLALLTVFLIGFYLRSHPFEIQILGDINEYIIQGAEIVIDGRYTFVRDPPSFSVIISIFQKIIGLKPLLGEFVNILLGSLSIPLIFIMIKLFFKKNSYALVSSILLSFSPLHYAASVHGFPFATSISFVFISFILLKLATKSNNIFMYVALAFSLGFTSQIYYVELVLILPFFFYILIKKRHNLPILWYFILIIPFIFSIIPFAVLQRIAPSEYTYHRSENTNSVICYWNKLDCNSGFNLKNAFVYNGENPIFERANKYGRNFPSFLAFLFLGDGCRLKTVDKDTMYDTDSECVSSKNRLYCMYIVLMAIGLYSGRRNPELILLLISMFLFIFLLSMDDNIHYLYPSYAEAVGIIPISSIGIVLLSRRMFNKILFVRLFVIIILILLTLPLFQEENFKVSNQNFVWQVLKSDVDVSFWSDKNCGYPYKQHKYICDKVAMLLDNNKYIK